MTDQTLNVRPPVGVLLLAVILGGGFFLIGKYIETRNIRAESPATVSVTGDAKSFASPNIAMLSFGVQTGKQPTAKAAMEKLSTGMNASLDAVKALGIAEKDIRTEQFSLSPVYDWTSGSQRLLGYEAMQTLSVKVRDLDKVSDVLTAATNAGANEAGNVQFTMDDPEKARVDARKQAIDQARAKAQKLADDLGMRLGRVTSFSEGGGGVPPIMMMDRMAAGGASEAKGIPLPPGEQEVDVTVSLTYELN